MGAAERYDQCEMDAAELWTKYINCDAHHKSLFAEQRSNLLLVAGLHYQNQSQKFVRMLRDLESVTKSQRIRLTKNHLQRITKTYRNNILQYAPNVDIVPRNERELSDVKVAALHKDVWLDICEQNKFPKLVRSWAQDFIDIGECAAKVFFDEFGGQFLGYDPLFDQHTGQPMLDEETGQQLYSEPIWTGKVCLERILGMNLLTDPDARSWEEARYVIYRKMLPIETLKAHCRGEPEKMAFLTSGAEETYKIFDGSTGIYRDSEGLIMVTEHYYRPCRGMENGYYYIAVQGGVLHEGELPLGLFPIVYAGFDEATTSARSFSIIKQLRPYTAEINRAASKIAEHQITLGDDKVMLSNGATMTPGGTAHGVKAIHVTGADPKVFAGRTGDQYVGYMQQQISEMYQVAQVDEDSQKDVSGQLDPYAILYKTARQKKPFMIYIAKFSEFLVEIAKLSLRYAKAFYSDEMLIPSITKNEWVNLPEFRSSQELGFQVRVVESTDDLESRMGKQLTLNHLIQFAGAQLERTDIGKIMRAMPYGNDKLAFSEITQDWDNWVNDQLAMDRGQMVAARERENHAYVLDRINGRMKEADFTLLPPQVQQNWEMKAQQHQKVMAEQAAAAERLKAGFIPTGGFLVTCEVYIPGAGGKQVRLRLPSETLMWANDAIAKQGTTQEMLQSLAPADQASVAQMVQQHQAAAGGVLRQPELMHA